MRVGLEKYAKCKRGWIESMYSIGNKVNDKGKLIRDFLGGIYKNLKCY